MRGMRATTVIAWVLLSSGSVSSQETQESQATQATNEGDGARAKQEPGESGDRSLSEPPAGEPPAATPAEASAEREWSLSASVYAFFIPGEKDYLQPIIELDRRWLHLEARYNYEDRDAASTWLGYNFSIGEKLAFEATPMVGAVFGHQIGVAPGYKFSLNYWKLELYSEGEYLFDVETTSDSFFYTWSELTISPLEWLRFGLVTQRTRAYETDVDIQRGLLLGFSYKFVDFTTHVFNLGWDDPTLVFSLGLSF